MSDLIKNMNDWFKENYYTNVQEGTDFTENAQETLYTHIIRSGGILLDSWVWWRLVRYPFDVNPKTGYYRYRLNVDMHFLGDPKEMEVVHKGKKVPVNKMEVEITINAAVEMDYRNEWKKDKLMGVIHDVFRKKMYWKQLTDVFNLMHDDVYRFHAMLKQFFKIESVHPEEAVPWPPKGFI